MGWIWWLAGVLVVTLIVVEVIVTAWPGMDYGDAEFFDEDETPDPGLFDEGGSM